ncbi:MAG: hypothetical protein JXA71_07415 [Chitinispirillaceae bacterium]|nr:hypothetical protein [Chitinispirillaceae bacterium]
MTVEKRSLLRTALTVAIVCTFGSLFTAGAEEETFSPKLVMFTGYSSFQVGQIVNGYWTEFEDKAYNHYWSHHVYAGVGFNAKMSDNLEIITRIEGKMWNPYAKGGTGRAWFQRNYSVWLDQAKITYGFGGLENPWLSITSGYFVYKYNPEVKDLGEFLFRSMTYPGFLINYFDFPAARLLGFKLSLDLLDGNLKQDIFLHQESEFYPFGGVSVGYIATGNLMNIIEVGAGFDLCRLFDINTELTTPHKSENRWVLGVDSSGLAITDPNNYYTFKANKVMGRMTIDPKPLMGSIGEMLGSSDLKLYGEIAVIGLKNYPYFYDDIKKRMPIMFGMNIPAFKLLDHLAVEFEHYAFPFSTNIDKIIEEGGYPQGKEPAATWNPENWTADDWKWAVHMKRTILPGLSLIVQLARDHYRDYWSDGLPAKTESLIRPDHMSWNAKITGSL